MDISEILDSLVNSGFEDTEEDEKVRKINTTLWDIESREPWPFLEKTATLNFDGTSPAPTNMPADFKAVMWLYDNTNAITIWPERLSTVRGQYGNTLSQVSDPFVYYFVGDELRLYPTPGASIGRYQLDYFATQPEVSATSVEADLLLPPRHHDVILLGVLYRLYKQEDDPENGNMFQIDYENKIQQMHEDLFRRQHQRADRIFVIDEDDDYLF